MPIISHRRYVVGLSSGFFFSLLFPQKLLSAVDDRSLLDASDDMLLTVLNCSHHSLPLPFNFLILQA